MSMAAPRLLWWEAWVASEAIPVPVTAKPIPSRVAVVTAEIGSRLFCPWEVHPLKYLLVDDSRE